MRMLPQCGDGNEVHFRYPTAEDIKNIYKLKAPVILSGLGYATMQHEKKEFFKMIQLIF